MNFWSIMTNTGLNLLNVTECGKLKSTTEIFPLMIAALVKSLGEYGNIESDLSYIEREAEYHSLIFH
jgi:hypothetical protein